MADLVIDFDHLAQFLIYPELTINNKEKQKSENKRNYKNCKISVISVQFKFPKFSLNVKENLGNLNWTEILKTQKCNTDSHNSNPLPLTFSKIGKNGGWVWKFFLEK